eukprot:TRINITY_DN51526_c0_g1_i1.p1 TRINITY_DN51526_c0_g1~~TRINITY_DN51526_c0_g1_i1.p1  ORF type:complete len:254 (-),score=34.56 TRINITY_DN51526_c0_g1_i1:665-1426(-)
MFSGRWEESITRDREGRIFLDFAPKLFTKILAHLRSCCLAPPTKRPKLSSVAIGDQEEFDLMLAYLGLTEPQLKLPIKLRPTRRVDISEDGSRATRRDWVDRCITWGGGNAIIVGDEPLVHHGSSGVAVWKVTVKDLIRGWMGIGIIAHESPPQESYYDQSCYMWGSVDEVWSRGECSKQDPDWSDWEKNDEAIFGLDMASSSLQMYHKRIAKLFELHLSPGVTGYRVHLSLAAQPCCVQLSEPSRQEAAWVR